MNVGLLSRTLEKQLEIWSHQGSVTQSAGTYGTIRSALEDLSATCPQLKYDIFLQGSYGNDTNIYAESDVDIVICLRSIIYSSARHISNYRHEHFKNDVFNQLKINFGADVKLGNKAISIKGNGSSRRDADVLPVFEYRGTRDCLCRAVHQTCGIYFYGKDGKLVINYPKQHAAALTKKHQGTNGNFKPMVRILKNIRTKMVESGDIKDGIAPSYFLECLLWNLPDKYFDASHYSLLKVLMYFLKNNWNYNLLCPHGQHGLFSENVLGFTAWDMADFECFIQNLSKFIDY